MTLPNVAHAEVSFTKVVGYLLNLEHLEGKGKARFFLALGFSTVQWEDFADALRLQAASNKVRETKSNEFGVKFIVDGEVRGPSGQSANIRTVWFIELGEEIPRLVTAHALPKSPRME